ncbi:MAG: hypothetical protein ABI977_00205 [Acidobacteriota bacterium]
MPALSRYRSERIRRIHHAARSAGCGFYILSGEYGLLAPDEPIPYYDHLLADDEIEMHAFKLAEQIKRYSITQIVFFTLPVWRDEKLAPYHAALRLACTIASVQLSFVEIDFA